MTQKPEAPLGEMIGDYPPDDPDTLDTLGQLPPGAKGVLPRPGRTERLDSDPEGLPI